MIRETSGLALKAKQTIEPFPVMNYFPWVETLNELCATAKTSHEKLVEGSRLVLHPAYHSLKLSKFVLECAFATYLFHYLARALIGCTPCHKRFYARYGFTPVKGTSVYRFGEFEGVCLLGSASDVPSGVRARLQRMAEVFEKNGQICCNPSATNSFLRPPQVKPTQTEGYRVAA